MIAIRAHAAGDLATAIPWYRVAVETEANQEAEARWAYAALFNLRERGQRVERLRGF